MFTGLIESMASVITVRKDGPEMDLEVSLGASARKPRCGDSIALSGVCCTIADLRRTRAKFQLSTETLRRTWFARLAPGTQLNVEPALRVGDPLGGHIVQGHVDAVGEVLQGVDPAGGGELWVTVPAELERYCIDKGSIAIDGVSLTIAAVDGPHVMVAIIPYTAAQTTIGGMQPRQPVNLEVDMVAKYVEKMVAVRRRI